MPIPGQIAVMTVCEQSSKWLARRLLLVSVLLILLMASAFTAELPALTGRVVDGANVIDAATREQMTRKLAAFEAKASDQVVVVTVPSLEGEEIEPYSNRLYRAWALGQKQENNGVLLVVAPNDRKVRIEVGYGLEGTLTDLLSKLIIENAIIPGFRSGDYSGGISKGVDGILTVLSGDAAESRPARNAMFRSNPPTLIGSWSFSSQYG